MPQTAPPPRAIQAPNAGSNAPRNAPPNAQPDATAPAQAAHSGPPTVFGGLNLDNVSLTEVINLLAQKLKINYILDPRVKGGIILNTYGETKDIDAQSLLEAILRINGFGMVKQGDLYRIVPLSDISHLPLPPEMKTDPATIPEDDRTMLNLVFLKYITADELAKVLTPFQGENAGIYVYSPANLLLMLDSQRSMRRTMQLVAMFDSDTLVNQRVHVFAVKNGRPSDVAKELENISKAMSFSTKDSPIKFLPIDRINTIIAVAPNPGAFKEVEEWLAKLDVPIKPSAGGIKDYVYRVRYGDAVSIACSIQALYGQLAGFGSGFGYPGGQNAILACMGNVGSGAGNTTYGGGPLPNGGFGNAIGGGGGYGGGFGGGGAYGSQYGGGYGGGYGASPYGAGAYGGGYGAPGAYGGAPFVGGAGAAVPNAPGAPAGAAGDLTGQYLGNAQVGFAQTRGPRVVANPINNTLLIQATPQEYEEIQQLLRELDIPPRQVLIEAKIYSVDLSHAFSSEVTAQLQTLSGTAPPIGGSSSTSSTPAASAGSTSTGTSTTGSSGTGTAITSTAASLLAAFSGGGAALTASMLVGKSRALSGIVSLMESQSNAKVISTPSIIATDSIPASINVGTTVPTLQGSITSAIGGGVTNSIGSASTGVGLTITARVTPSGIVTLIINQSVSDPTATSTSSIGSPSFATKNISTQVTVQDGDTIAIGGQIQESTTSSLGGIPLLDRIPVLGALFGSRSYSKERTELIMFITPHVIFDSNQLLDASDDLKDQIKVLRKDIKE
ncbi:MAG: type II secretion system secretin GspD [Bryobacteraceae bacterium]